MNDNAASKESGMLTPPLYNLPLVCLQTIIIHSKEKTEGPGSLFAMQVETSNTF
jgi:hypothetical protein